LKSLGHEGKAPVAPNIQSGDSWGKIIRSSSDTHWLGGGGDGLNGQKKGRQRPILARRKKLDRGQTCKKKMQKKKKKIDERTLPEAMSKEKNSVSQEWKRKASRDTRKAVNDRKKRGKELKRDGQRIW